MVQSASNQGCLDETERTLRGQELELTTRELPVFLRRHRVFVSAVAILLGIGLILGEFGIRWSCWTWVWASTSLG